METTGSSEAQKTTQDDSAQQNKNLVSDQSADNRKSKAGKRKPQTRKVTDYIMYVEEVLGIGQFGKVVKAQKQSECKESKNPPTYACKIMEITNISKDDMDCIEKEVRLHDKVVNEHCIRLYQTIKTTSNIYMVIEYCNGSDLAVLLSVRKHLNQMEVSLILR